ncbi:neurexin-4-like [Branchiostoma lanceolatum]|uniref:neurexin-4-like n=1 Tax=Branchiostoma lanceolatum TaxID=7740 RepID=UPI003451ADB6
MKLCGVLLLVLVAVPALCQFPPDNWEFPDRRIENNEDLREVQCRHTCKDVKALKRRMREMESRVLALEDAAQAPPTGLLKMLQLEGRIRELEQLLLKSNKPSKLQEVVKPRKDQGTTDTHVSASCAELKDNGYTESGTYTIDPDDLDYGVEPFQVFCDMTSDNDTGITVVGHDSEERMLVNGWETAGSYEKDISYYGASMEQVAALIKASKSCKQFLKYECFSSAIHGRIVDLDVTYASWESRQGEKMDYWAGASPGSGKCACGETGTCDKANPRCNCDVNDKRWRADEGYLTDKATLPVSRLNFGDTGHEWEQGYHTLGKLECTGY